MEQARAAEPDVIVSPLPPADSFKDFLEVSYSFDGIRWTAIGRVNRDNWKNFKVEVPVTSWDEVKRLQIMISVLPTIDEKPDIYLDNISMRAEYSQTLAELAAQGFAAVSNAVDALIGDGNDASNAVDFVPEEKKGPQPVDIVKKKLVFAANGTMVSRPRDDSGRGAGDSNSNNSKKSKNNSTGTRSFTTTSSPDGSSLKVSGTCTQTYFVILTYRNQTDYFKKPGSFIANEAHECLGGQFTYDLASLSTDIRSGTQYLLIADEDEMGPWVPASDLYPITIQASTTVETIYQ